MCISSHQWIETLLQLAQCSKTMLLAEHFRCKLLILRLLRQTLPYLQSSNTGRKKVCNKIFLKFTFKLLNVCCDYNRLSNNIICLFYFYLYFIVKYHFLVSII